MSSDIAISTSGLSKAYRIVHQRTQPTTLAEAFTNRLRNPRGREEAETFWALRDVDLTIHKGEVVGIIGRNGAGKSTLLKILSRITEPSAGEARIYGRVGSLLEVGTGFHAELTGRENIYLNGAVLGMKRSEIVRRFGEIVAFAEIDRFLDTPVKRYSSGMYVRLAFAVAAHMDTNVLLVDEVLAVGDTAFQERCLGKMGDVVRAGRTVLFVSHNLGAVRSLCHRILVVRDGRVVVDGTTDDSITAYLSDIRDPDKSGRALFIRPNGAMCWMNTATLRSARGATGVFQTGEPLTLDVEFAAETPIREPKLGFVIRSADGTPVLNANNHYQPAASLPSHPLLAGAIRCELGPVPLMPGRYMLSLWLGLGNQDTHVAVDALSFDVEARDIWGRGRLPPAGVSHLWWPTSFCVGLAETDNGA